MERAVTPEFEGDLQVLLESINTKYNYDFRHYASRSMQRTLVQAMDRMGCPTIPVLQERVLGDPACFAELVQSLTIPVSEMFRDASYFRSLREFVFPLLKTYPSLKLWVAGCSSGEEAYSLAIALQEEELLARTTIYATDINPRVLELATKGAFPLDELAVAGLRYLQAGGKRALADYYAVGPGGGTFAAALRANITFSDHSLVTDAVFSETHLISCRNVLIYFNRALQDRVFGLFYESLCRKGFLGLGGQETVQFSRFAPHFAPIVKSDRIFQRK